jgi:hypothetical protein
MDTDYLPNPNLLPIINKIQLNKYILITKDKFNNKKYYYIHINENDDERYIFDYYICKNRSGHTAVDYLNKRSTG